MAFTGPNQENAANLIITSKKKNIKGKINELPKDSIKIIVANIDWEFFVNLSQVSKLWHNLVKELSQEFINKYFPYLKKHPLYTANPIKLIVEERHDYKTDFDFIDTSFILAALSGDKNTIAKRVSPYYKNNIFLYSLLLANDHMLPEGLKKDDKNQIIEKAFTWYARNGKLDALKQYLPQQVAEFHKDVALEYAASRGHVEIVAYLLTLEISSLGKVLALKAAASKNHVEIVKILVSLKEIQSCHKEEILIWAASQGHLDVVNLLHPLKNLKDEAKQEALIAGAKKGYIEVIKLLFHETFCSEGKRRALIKATSRGHYDLVNYLIQQKEFFIKDIGLSLKKAASKGHLEIVKLLFSFENKSKYQIVFQEAAINGYLEMMKFVLPSLSYFEKAWALRYAARCDQLEMVKYLSTLPDTKFCSKDIELALIDAVERAHIQVVKYLGTYLQKQGMNLEEKQSFLFQKVRVLREAIKYNNFDIVKHLLMFYEIPIFYQKIMLQEAQNKKYTKIASFIQENLNKKVNEKNKKIVTKLEMLKSFLHKPSYYPVKLALILGFIMFICSIPFVSLTSGLFLSSLMGLNSYIAIRTRNHYINQCKNSNTLDMAIHTLYVYKQKKEQEEQTAYLSGCEAANSWPVYLNGFLSLNNWKHPICYTLGMESRLEEENSGTVIKP